MMFRPFGPAFNRAARLAGALAVCALVVCALAACDRGAGPTIAPPPAAMRATVTIRTIALDGDANARVVARAAHDAEALDSAAGTAGGTVVLVVPVDSSIDVSIEPVDRDRYYTSRGHVVATRDTTIDVIMLPNVWTIRHGVYAGSTQRIDLAAAMATISDGSRSLNTFTPWPTVLAAWSPAAYPIPIGFDTSGVAQWTAADSTLFWSVIAEIDSVVGQRLFRPADRGDFAPRGGIGLRLNKAGTPYLGSINVDYDHCGTARRVCTSLQGEVSFIPGFFYNGYSLSPKDRDDERRHFIAHELIHALGFGHACAWASVMRLSDGACIPETEIPTYPTMEDVAYVEFVQALAAALVDHPYAWHVNEAAAAR